MNKELTINGISVLILRVCLSGIFIVAGISHIINPHQVATRIEAANFSNLAEAFGDPFWLGLATGYALLSGGIALIAGVYTRWAAVLLFFVLIPITATIQMGNGMMHGPLWKNIALFGCLLFFIINNPKNYSIYNK